MWFKGKLCRKHASAANRAKRILATFGITVAEYDQLLAAQGGVCAICKLPPKTSRYHIDHDHKTGLIRGILCMWCNHKLLAGAREKISILESAAIYLKHPPAVIILGVRLAPKKKDKPKKSGPPLAA